jgi:phenylpropionate dioxygenase-like ring-hydroxylating dioxygenase large terminal subunit
MTFDDFWYVVAQSNQLQPNQVIGRTVLGEWLAVFRDQEGRPVALRDRCMHRNSRLSCGRVQNGILRCPYHGWGYDTTGQVVVVPAEGHHISHLPTRVAKRYATQEQDGYIYVNLSQTSSCDLLLENAAAQSPFKMPHYGELGWQMVRVINRFHNTVTHCAENFIDIPHTAFVHPGIFRTSRQQQLEMMVERRNGSVFVEYFNETTNLGWYRRFLNRHKQPIRHTDSFHMPNVTSVHYDIGKHRQLFITSQSIPETQDSTLVYTDVTYNYGIWSWLARPLVWWTAQHIIQQDIQILGIQQEVIEKYGAQFSNTPADTIHVFIESIRACLAKGTDPRELPEKSATVTFWV